MGLLLDEVGPGNQDDRYLMRSYPLLQFFLLLLIFFLLFVFFVFIHARGIPSVYEFLKIAGLPGR